MSISHNLNATTTIRLVDKPKLAEESQKYRDRFLLNYPQKWLDTIAKENKFKLEEVYKGKAVRDSSSQLNFSLIRISPL